MHTKIAVLCIYVISVTNGYFVGTGSRGILSNIFGDGKPGTVDYAGINWTAPTVFNDGCEREYPLSPKNSQMLALAGHRYGLVPQITPYSPPYYLTVKYENINKCQPHLGNEVDVCKLTEPPTDIKWNCKPSRLYTLFFVDIYPLGIKNAPLMQLGLLWWIVDIPNCDISRGTTLYEYQQPLPLYGSDTNRYTFSVFEQPPYPIDWSSEPLVSATSEKYRYYFCATNIIKYDLKINAGNFFTSRFQPCVEEGLDKLDKPSPQYVTKSEERANLPADPYATSR